MSKEPEEATSDIRDVYQKLSQESKAVDQLDKSLPRILSAIIIGYLPLLAYWVLNFGKIEIQGLYLNLSYIFFAQITRVELSALGKTEQLRNMQLDWHYFRTVLKTSLAVLSLCLYVAASTFFAFSGILGFGLFYLLITISIILFCFR